MSGSWHRLWRVGGWLALVLAQDAGLAQVPEGPVRGFDLPLVDRRTARRTARVRGEIARPVGKDIVELSGLRFEAFGQGGVTNLVILAEACRLLPLARRLESSSELRVVSGDGILNLQGQGFSWDEPVGLIISNKVAAVVMRATGGTPGLATSTGPEGTPQRLEITADRFTYREGVATFGPGVRVVDPEGTLSCARLGMRLNLPDPGAEVGAPSDPQGGRLESVEAEGGVEVRSPVLEARADRAVYVMASRRLSLAGGARWRSGDREGQADQIRLDRSERVLLAEKDVRVRFPAAGLSSGQGVFPGPAQIWAATLSTGHVEIQSTALEVRPDPAATNETVALFSSGVRVLAGGGHLEGERLTLRYVEESPRAGVQAGFRSEPGIRPLSAVAEGDVRVEQGTNRVRCVRATYTAAAGSTLLEGPVEWVLGGQEGRAASVVVRAAERSVLARGDVRLRLTGLPIEAPGRLLQTPVPGVDRRRTEPSAPAAEPVEVHCAEFEYFPGVSPEVESRAETRGGVVVTRSASFRMTCREMEVRMLPRENRLVRLEAKRDVRFEALPSEGQPRARGELAVYRGEEQLLWMGGEPEVEFVLKDAGGTSVARGREASYDVRRDVLELSGAARIESERGSLTGDRLRFDRAGGAMAAGGQWRIRLPVKALRQGIPGERR